MVAIRRAFIYGRLSASSTKKYFWLSQTSFTYVHQYLIIFLDTHLQCVLEQVRDYHYQKPLYGLNQTVVTPENISEGIGLGQVRIILLSQSQLYCRCAKGIVSKIPPNRTGSEESVPDQMKARVEETKDLIIR